MADLNNTDEAFYESVPLYLTQEEHSKFYSPNQENRKKHKSYHQKEDDRNENTESTPFLPSQDEESTDTDPSDNESHNGDLLTQPNLPDSNNEEQNNHRKSKSIQREDDSDAEQSHVREVPGPSIIADGVELVYSTSWTDKIFLLNYIEKNICIQNMESSSQQNSSSTEEELKNNKPSNQSSSTIREIGQIHEMLHPNESSTFSLPSLHIKRIWKKRSTKLTTPYQEDNGPLALAYKSVLSIEVAMVTNIHSSAFSRIRIYFYNTYADILSRHLSTDMRLKLKNISTKCLFPNVISDEKNDGLIVDQKSLLSPTSICIGSKSKMRLQNTAKIRFDDEISIYWQDDPSKKTLLLNSEKLDSLLGYEEVETLNELWNDCIDADASSKDRNESGHQHGIENLDNSVQIDTTLQNINFHQKDSYQIGGEEYHSLTALKKYFEKVSFKNSPKQFNCFAVVLSSTAPRITSYKGDLFMSLTITDDSFQMPNVDVNDEQLKNDVELSQRYSGTRITLNSFQKDRNSRIFCNAGDIIRCHRILIQNYNGDLQLCARHFSSIVVAHPKQPLQILEKSRSHSQNEAREFFSDWDFITVSKSFSFDPLHGKRFQELWTWGQHRLSIYPTSFDQDQHCTISQLETNCVILEAEKAAGLEKNRNPHVEVAGDMTVMITDIVPMIDTLQHLPKGYLRVWDGTGASMTDVHPISRKPINHYELSKNVLDSIDRVVHRINKLHPKEPPMSPPSYFIGRIVNVAIWENSHWDVIFGQQWGKDDEFDDIESNIKSFRKKFKIGNFIRLRNVKDGRTLNDQRSIMVHSRSSITLIPDTTYEVRKIFLNHEKKMNFNVKCNPNSDVKALQNNKSADDDCYGNFVDFVASRKDLQNDLRFDTIDAALSLSMHRVTASFPILFRVQRLYPDLKVWDESHKAILSGLKSFCFPVIDGFEYNFEHETNNGKRLFYFRFSATIYDETAELDALICNKEAEKLLGVTADEVYLSQGEDKATTSLSRCRHNLNILMCGIWKGKVKRQFCGDLRYFILESCCLHKE